MNWTGSIFCFLRWPCFFLFFFFCIDKKRKEPWQTPWRGCLSFVTLVTVVLPLCVYNNKCGESPVRKYDQMWRSFRDRMNAFIVSSPEINFDINYICNELSDVCQNCCSGKTWVAKIFMFTLNNAITYIALKNIAGICVKTNIQTLNSPTKIVQHTLVSVIYSPLTRVVDYE